MKNKEYYKEKIIEAYKNDCIGGFFDEYVKPKYNTTYWCELDYRSADLLLYLWLDEEYEEPKEVFDWSKVKVDTPILVSTDGKKWFHRHFSEYSGGKVYAFDDGTTSWSKCGDTCWPYAKLANPQKTERDGCVGCMYESLKDLPTEENPCVECREAYEYRYVSKNKEE